LVIFRDHKAYSVFPVEKREFTTNYHDFRKSLEEIEFEGSLNFTCLADGLACALEVFF